MTHEQFFNKLAKREMQLERMITKLQGRAFRTVRRGDLRTELRSVRRKLDKLEDTDRFLLVGKNICRVKRARFTSGTHNDC